MPKKLITAFSSGRWGLPAKAEPGAGRPVEKDGQRRVGPGFPAEALKQAAGRDRTAEQDQQDHHEQALEFLGEVVQLLVIFAAPLGRAQGQRRHEHGEETVAVRDLRHPIGQARDAEGHEAVPRAGELGAVRQMERGPAQRQADCVADADPGGDLPDHGDRQPLDEPRLPGPARDREKIAR